MNNIRNEFSIKDLENLSGIKAHTIRIWEKRYNILEPMRTDTNIRLYDLANLQKLLNINLLHQHGYKISKIATYKEEEIPEITKGIITSVNANNHAISDLKIAMVNFNQELFSNTFDWLLKDKSFREIFVEVLIPLMTEIGYLWQTDTISPAHEHFITHLIRQKLMLMVHNNFSIKPTKNEKVFVLSLPMNEIHDIGLLYLYYEITNSGYKVVYLGESMPNESLSAVKKQFSNLVYVSYLTVKPIKDEIQEYIQEMQNELIDETTEIWLLGRMVEHLEPSSLSPKVKVFESIPQLLAIL
jgi:DNA-binding transcriptional MerR regulator